MVVTHACGGGTGGGRTERCGGEESGDIVIARACCWLAVVMMSDTFSFFPPFLSCLSFLFLGFLISARSFPFPFVRPAVAFLGSSCPSPHPSVTLVRFLIFNAFSVANVDGGVAKRAVHSGSVG